MNDRRSDCEQSKDDTLLSRDSLLSHSNASRTSRAQSSEYSSRSERGAGRHATRESSSSKYSDSWKMYLLPEFRQAHFLKNSQKTTTVFANFCGESANRLKKFETPKRQSTTMTRGGDSTDLRPLVTSQSAQLTTTGRKPRSRRFANVNSELNTEIVERVIEENKRLKEELEYMREKFESCLMNKQKREVSEATKDSKQTARFSK